MIQNLRRFSAKKISKKILKNINWLQKRKIWTRSVDNLSYQPLFSLHPIWTCYAKILEKFGFKNDINFKIGPKSGRRPQKILDLEGKIVMGMVDKPKLERIEFEAAQLDRS